MGKILCWILAPSSNGRSEFGRGIRLPARWARLALFYLLTLP